MAMKYCIHPRELIKKCKTMIIPPKTAGPVYSHGENFAGYIRDTYGFEKGLPVLPITTLFPDFSEVVCPLSMLSDGSSPMDIALLKGLAKKIPHCTYLEIGTWRGESIANVATVAEKCYSISLSAEEALTMGLEERDTEILDFFSKDLKNVLHIKANSLSYNFATLGTTFDLIFIDGDHSRHAVESDTKNAFKLLRDTHSMIVWHDYGRTPERIRWDVLAGILDGCPPEFRNNIYHVSNTLCAIFIPGNYPTKEFYFPALPENVFEVTIRLKHTMS